MINPVDTQALPAYDLKSTILVKLEKRTKFMRHFELVYILHKYLYSGYT